MNIPSILERLETNKLIMKQITPPIKCQGTKRRLVPWIKLHLPPHVDEWVEPFMGSGAVGFNVEANTYLMGDTNPHIINFYTCIQKGEINPYSTREYLEQEGAKLKEKGEPYYCEVRERFNKDQSAFDFLFLNRSSFNGLIRFNKKGEFNTPFCKKPERFSKAYITRIVNQVEAVWHRISDRNYEFKCMDFEDTIWFATKDSIIYMDPPYMGRTAGYYNDWTMEDERRMADALRICDGQYIVSTWTRNKHRENELIREFYPQMRIETTQHYYHVGGHEANRGSVEVSLVFSF